MSGLPPHLVEDVPPMWAAQPLEARRLKECWRLAWHDGRVARFRGLLRGGGVARFIIYPDEGFSDGLAWVERTELVGEFQLRFRDDCPPPLAHYSVFGRARAHPGEEPRKWIPVDGPWRCGEGPFDNRR